jgi:hypothetical protein
MIYRNLAVQNKSWAFVQKKEIFMQIAIYIISALLTDYVFSVMTAILITAGFDKMGSDPGSPGIMLVSLLCINGMLSIVTAVIMGIAKAKHQKEFPAKFSALIFLLTYFPFHIIGLYFSDVQLGFLEAPLGILLVVMLFFSYIPFFHMTAQGLINLNEFVKRQESAGNRHVKLIVLASLGAIVLFAGWLIFKPETQPSTGVLSLQDNWQLLEAGGQDWQSDAYLQNIVFYPNSRLPYEISATYLSKSTPEEIYSIDINKKSKIYLTETSETYEMRESAKLPIKRDDWSIGSIQAWNMFMQIESVNSCVKPSEKNAFFYMALHRIASGRLAWDLSISGCSTLADHSSYYLDAKTGETIESYFK